MSIQPLFAEAIYSGVKRHEFRRVRTSFSKGDQVLIYEPLPVGLITGEYTVNKVYYGLPEEIILLEANSWMRSLAEQYLNGTQVASAIEVINAVKWKKAMSLQEVLPGARPPQSYMFIKGGNEWGSSL